MKELMAGDMAPEFSARDQNGRTVSLSDFRGKKVVFYTYPEDDTPTCTIEACNLRDHHAELTSRGLVVLGISPDDTKSHKKFETKFNLPFTLLSDPELHILKLYGVYGEKNMYGRKYMGIFRRTFLINEEGMIVHIIKGVRSSNHAAQVLKAWGL